MDHHIRRYSGIGRRARPHCRLRVLLPERRRASRLRPRGAPRLSERWHRRSVQRDQCLSNGIDCSHY